MRYLKLVLPAGLVMGGFMLCTTASYGKPEYMKKEGIKSCAGCHSKMPANKTDLTELGACYGKNDHSLAKCKVPDGVKK